MNLSRQFTRREKALLIILALLILVALYFYCVQYPASEASGKYKSETGNIDSEIVVMNAKKAKMDKMSGELEDLMADPDTVQIPEYDNLQQVIGFLNTALRNTEDYTLSFPGIDFPRADTSEHIVRRYLNLTFVSESYGDARKVIDDLQASPYCSQVNDISIASVTEDGKTKQGTDLLAGRVEVTLSMTFFENTK